MCSPDLIFGYPSKTWAMFAKVACDVEEITMLDVIIVVLTLVSFP